MRSLPPDLSARLAGGCTTLARCWKLIRNDGVVQGFTDHDRDLEFAGVAFAAASGLEAADSESQLGFAVGGGEVAGALSAASLTESDLAAGRYDGASVETWLVDWQDPACRILLDIHVIGEVRRSGGAFVAELRGLAHRLDEPRGRVFQASCGADLGDPRCGVDLANPAWRATGVVSTCTGDGSFATADLGRFEEGAFTGGRLVFTSGPNAGSAGEIRLHRRGAEGDVIELWQPLAKPASGDGFTATVGCDKRLETCRDRFSNVANFRGFPHMPGNDFILRAARQGEASMDGGSLFR